MTSPLYLILLIVFGQLYQSISSIECDYYPFYPSIDVIRTQICNETCCEGSPANAVDACCHHEEVFWWVMIIVFGVVLIVLVTTIIGCILHKDKKNTIRFKEINGLSRARNTLQSPKYSNPPPPIHQMSSNEPPNYNSVMNQVATYYMNSDTSQPLPAAVMPGRTVSWNARNSSTVTIEQINDTTTSTTTSSHLSIIQQPHYIPTTQ